MMVCISVQRHTEEEAIPVYSFLGLFHSGCMHPPGDDGVVDTFKTFHLWSLHSRVEPGGEEFTGTSCSQEKIGLGEKWWGNGQVVMRKCGKSHSSLLSCHPPFLPRHYIIPPLFTYQFGLKTMCVMMVPVHFHSGKHKESFHPTTL